MAGPPLPSTRSTYSPLPTGEAFSEGPLQGHVEALNDHGDVLCDEDGDVISDYIDKAAFKDIVG